jgi:hypothetical protein
MCDALLLMATKRYIPFCASCLGRTAERRQVIEMMISAGFRKNRGDWRCTFVNETIGLSLIRGILPQRINFKGDALAAFVEAGLYAKKASLTISPKIVPA